MTIKVKDYPEMFTEGEEFPSRLRAIIPEFLDAASGDVFNTLLYHYYDYFYIYKTDYWKERVLQAFKAKKNWLNEMLKTTQYEYNPIHNVDENTTETLSKNDDVTDTVDSNSHSDSGSYDFPMDTTKSKQTAHTEGSATGSTARVTSAESAQTLTRRRAGNIGVTSTQQLIRQQREVQLVLIHLLYSVFDDFLFLDVDRLEE